MAISGVAYKRLLSLIEAGQADKFYTWKSWDKVREKVLKLDHYECQKCKRHGRYRKGNIVHHIKHLKDRPDLAMSIFDPETGERQLETVCKECHEEEHPESLKRYSATERKALTEERWD